MSMSSKQLYVLQQLELKQGIKAMLAKGINGGQFVQLLGGLIGNRVSLALPVIFLWSDCLLMFYVFREMRAYLPNVKSAKYNQMNGIEQKQNKVSYIGFNVNDFQVIQAQAINRPLYYLPINPFAQISKEKDHSKIENAQKTSKTSKYTILKTLVPSIKHSQKIPNKHLRQISQLARTVILLSFPYHMITLHPTNNFNAFQLIVITPRKQLPMKPRTVSLPTSDQKIRIHTPDQFIKHHQTNRTQTRFHHQSTITNKNQLGLQSAIKDDQKDINKILVRRNKAKFQKKSEALDRNMRKTMNYLSTRYRPDENNRNSSQSLQKSEKEKFIGILQDKILKKQAQELPKEADSKPQQTKPENLLASTQYQNGFKPLTYRISMPNATLNESVEQNRHSRDHNRSLDRRPQPKSHRNQKIQNHIQTVRSRSRTLARDRIEIRVSPCNKNNEVSRTIQLQPDYEQIKINKSLIQIEKMEKHSHAKDTKDFNMQMPKIAEQKQDPSLNINALRHKQSTNNMQSNLDRSFTNLKNTQQYQNEVNILTKDFFHQWQRMNTNKSKIYKVLRKKLVSVFPNLKKHYQEFRQQLQNNEKKQGGNHACKKQDIEQIMIDLNSNLKSDRIGQSFNPAQSKDFQQRMEQFHQRQQLKDIFKQAYFWSRTKNKSMSTKFGHEEEMEKGMSEIKKIQKNLTFMNYMKSKTNKSQILYCRNKIKGANIVKNKESILQIQKQGTKQQQFLKKCLDNAIQNCMKAFQ